jgi:hypothetical protein
MPPGGMWRVWTRRFPKVAAAVAGEATSDAVDRFANEVGDTAGRAYESAEKTVSDFVEWVGGCTLYADCP